MEVDDDDDDDEQTTSSSNNGTTASLGSDPIPLPPSASTSQEEEFLPDLHAMKMESSSSSSSEAPVRRVVYTSGDAEVPRPGPSGGGDAEVPSSPQPVTMEGSETEPESSSSGEALYDPALATCIGHDTLIYLIDGVRYFLRGPMRKETLTHAKINFNRTPGKLEILDRSLKSYLEMPFTEVCLFMFLTCFVLRLESEFVFYYFFLKSWD